MPVAELKQLLERIHTRLDESQVGISQVVADLAPADLADLLNELTAVMNGNPKYVFWQGRGTADSETKRLQGEMRELMKAAGVYIKGNVFHRFRDTAVDFWIGQGWSLTDVATALGDTVQKMGHHERHLILPKLSAEIRKELEGLLQYPVHTAGGIMTTEFVRLEPKMTVGEALKQIRSGARERESIYACYVMEPGTGHLLGAVSLRDLVMAELSTPVTEVMRKKPATPSNDIPRLSASSKKNRSALAHDSPMFAKLEGAPFLAADGDLLAQLRDRQRDLQRTGWAGANGEANCGRLETLVLDLNFVPARRYGFKAECAPGVGRCGLLFACPGPSKSDLGPRNAGMGRIEHDAGYRKGRRRRLRKCLLSGTEQQHYGKQNTQILDEPRARYTVDLDLFARNPPHPVLPLN